MAGGLPTNRTMPVSFRFTYGPIQISTGSARKCRPPAAHSRCGREMVEELFYVDAEGAIVSVRVGQGTTWSASPGTRTPLPINRYFRASVNSAGRTYDVSPDGKRFLMIKDAGTPSQASAPTSIVVVRNWVEELKRLVPVRP